MIGARGSPGGIKTQVSRALLRKSIQCVVSDETVWRCERPTVDIGFEDNCLRSFCTFLLAMVIKSWKQNIADISNHRDVVAGNGGCSWVFIETGMAGSSFSTHVGQVDEPSSRTICFATSMRHRAILVEFGCSMPTKRYHSSCTTSQFMFGLSPTIKYMLRILYTFYTPTQRALTASDNPNCVANVRCPVCIRK